MMICICGLLLPRLLNICSDKDSASISLGLLSVPIRVIRGRKSPFFVSCCVFVLRISPEFLTQALRVWLLPMPPELASSLV